jgi:hypothetical protein
MDITYDIIIQHLCPSSIKKEQPQKEKPWITQKNIHNWSKDWDKFSSIFTDKFYRYGLTFDINNSFWYSLLTLLDKKFITNTDEITTINKFKEELLEQYKKVSIDKSTFRNMLKAVPSLELMEAIVKILNINIIVLDWTNEKLKAVYEKSFNPWIPTLFLAYYKNNWEPIMNSLSKGSIRRTFNYNDQVLKKILESNQIEPFNDKYKWSLLDINQVIKQEKEKYQKENIKVVSEKEELDDSDVHTENEELLASNKTQNLTESSIEIEQENPLIKEIKSWSKSKMSKMTKDDLLVLCVKLKLNHTKNDTKDNIICSIKKFLV